MCGKQHKGQAWQRPPPECCYRSRATLASDTHPGCDMADSPTSWPVLLLTVGSLLATALAFLPPFLPLALPGFLPLAPFLPLALPGFLPLAPFLPLALPGFLPAAAWASASFASASSCS